MLGVDHVQGAKSEHAGEVTQCKPASLSPGRTSNVSQSTSSDVMQAQAPTDAMFVLVGAVAQAEGRG